MKASVEKLVGNTMLATATPTIGTQGQPGTDLGSKSFFKTPAGIITLVALATGVGYALYSTSHDRVKSPAR